MDSLVRKKTAINVILDIPSNIDKILNRYPRNMAGSNLHLTVTLTHLIDSSLTIELSFFVIRESKMISILFHESLNTRKLYKCQSKVNKKKTVFPRFYSWTYSCDVPFEMLPRNKKYLREIFNEAKIKKTESD